MKKRKSSVMWGVALVLIFGFAFFLNATSFMTRPLFPPKPQAAPEQPTLTEDQSREQMRRMLSSRRGEDEHGHDHSHEHEAVPARPAIFKPEFRRVDPIENETSTSGQWWRPEGRVEEKSEEVRRKRGF